MGALDGHSGTHGEAFACGAVGRSRFVWAFLFRDWLEAQALRSDIRGHDRPYIAIALRCYSPLRQSKVGKGGLWKAIISVLSFLNMVVNHDLASLCMPSQVRLGPIR